MDQLHDIDDTAPRRGREKPKRRAWRRAQTQRIKKNRQQYWGRDLSGDPVAHGIAIDTPKTCSCFMCGNERRYFNQVTVQEKRAALATLDEDSLSEKE